MGTRKYSRNAEESEKTIERYLTLQVQQNGGLCLKYTNANVTGYPDRVMLFPGKQDIWVEIKSKGKTPNSLQVFRIRRLRDMGRKVYVVDSREGVDRIMLDIFNPES